MFVVVFVSLLRLFRDWAGDKMCILESVVDTQTHHHSISDSKVRQGELKLFRATVCLWEQGCSATKESSGQTLMNFSNWFLLQHTTGVRASERWSGHTVARYLVRWGLISHQQLLLTGCGCWRGNEAGCQSELLQAAELVTEPQSNLPVSAAKTGNAPHRCRSHFSLMTS